MILTRYLDGLNSRRGRTVYKLSSQYESKSIKIWTKQRFSQHQAKKIISSKTPMKLTPSQKEKRDKKKARLALRAMNKKVKRENKSLPKKADDLWSKVVRKAWECAVCWKKENLNAHHIFTRHNKSVRWDLDNGICLCSGCHVFSDIFSAHKCPTEFTYWLEKQYSREWLEALGRKAKTPQHIDTEYLKATIIYLKSLA